MKKVALIAAIAMAIAGLQGCAGMSQGPSDEAQILDTLNSWKTAMQAEDVDAALNSYADTYKDAEGRGKTEIKSFLEEVKSGGYLAGLDVDLEKTEITVEEGGTATATPVALYGNFGGLTLTISLAKGADGWKITNVQEY